RRLAVVGRTQVNVDLRVGEAAQGRVAGPVPVHRRGAEVVAGDRGLHLLPDRALLDVGQQEGEQADVLEGGAGGPGRVRVGAQIPRRQLLEVVVVVVGGQADLLEVVLALHPRRRVADLLDRGQEQADEEGNDGNHHQQLDQRDPTPTC